MGAGKEAGQLQKVEPATCLITSSNMVLIQAMSGPLISWHAKEPTAGLRSDNAAQQGRLEQMLRGALNVEDAECMN